MGYYPSGRACPQCHQEEIFWSTTPMRITCGCPWPGENEADDEKNAIFE